MPEKLPLISGQECVKALQRAGFEVETQKGSHIRLKAGSRRVTVPNHKTLDRGTLKSIIGQAGLTQETFVALL